jgi:hypothetical protein
LWKTAKLCGHARGITQRVCACLRVWCFFFGASSTDSLIITSTNTKKSKSNKNINRSLDHLATNINISTSRRRAAILVSALPKLGKAYHNRACCSRQTRSRHAKTPKNQRTREETIADDENRRSKEIGLKPHKQSRARIWW